jgi:cyclopropane fatty-acyl-phospholipid synthase-like methyltransferase
MIYTSGVISDINKEESLEQLQDNKLALVCEKLALEPTDRLLDIGCGWGTLAAFAGKNYGCDVTGGTSISGPFTSQSDSVSSHPRKEPNRLR